MSMKRPTTATLGAAIVTSLAGMANAAENPFALKDLAQGYAQVAEAGKETKEMVCGEGKCGGSMMKSADMNCGAMMQKAKEQEAGQTKAMEGKCASPAGGAAPAATPAAPAAAPTTPAK